MAPPQQSSAAAVSFSAPPSTTAAVSPVVVLVVRILTVICLFISIIILATSEATATDVFGDEVTFRFSDFYAFRYMMASMILGGAYVLLQTAFSIFQVSTGNRIGGDALLKLEFYGDKAISYLLATGMAASFGLTVDLNRLPGSDSSPRNFLNKVNAAASILLLGFLFSAASSIFSSFSLPKRSY